MAPVWTPPPTGFTKINVDAALFKNSNILAVAAIARDSAGVFLGASAVVLEGITDAEIAKALAYREGLTLAKDIHVQKLRFASDCANVIRNIKGGSMGTYSQIVREIRSGGQLFEFAEFVHENRRTNGDAHRLARSSLYNSTGRHVWFLSPPDGVCNSILE